MGLTSHLATLLVLHASAGYLAAASSGQEWLPADNQTWCNLRRGERRSLELNTSLLTQRVVFITVSPCTGDIHWALHQGKTGAGDGHLTLVKEHSGPEMSVISLVTAPDMRYVLQLSSIGGGAAVVVARGEAARAARLRLRARSRRRLTANWDPSFHQWIEYLIHEEAIQRKKLQSDDIIAGDFADNPIDPQSTTYCVVASQKKNYTSLCAAQYDIKMHQIDIDSRLNEYRVENATRIDSGEIDNAIEPDAFNIYEGNYKTVFRRKKIGRSTKVSDIDPVIACVGDRTHHLFENLDPTMRYFVSIFGIAKDRRAGSLLASGSVRPRTSTAKKLKENVPYKADIRSKNVFYVKAPVGTEGGLWMTVTTCGGSVDLEVLVRGKRVYVVKNIEPHSKFFVPAPVQSFTQETSDESAVFDSSSEEAMMRYVVKIVPSRSERDGVVGVEITASSSRWGLSVPELPTGGVGGAAPRELRPRRSCTSLHIAFLPAHHAGNDVIRYCIATREMNGESSACGSTNRRTVKTQCADYVQQSQSKVIVQKITGLKAGRKYAIQVSASTKGNSVPYNVLYADTSYSCNKN